VLTFLVEERPLANSLREEPQAEIDAEEASLAAAAAAPATVTR
jgi:hypothetical protein